eukprot:TRINITY_DN16140_c0_g1_i1.p1 TRINITY_DN16140_c0_g1~~TRINITY_DN16140_c0_g1_i1.p1  ORF type:complete len:305 (+),score=23.28 TRINITY_DN16140_c0_g1_i1:78-992(+)
MALTSICSHGEPLTPEEFKGLLVPVNITGTLIGILLLIGATVSVLPQHIKILRTKDTVGIAPIWLFLSNVNQFAAVINAVLLKFPQFRACHALSFAQCAPSLISAFQLIAIWIVALPIYIWFLIFTPHDKKSPRRMEWTLSVILFAFLLLFIVVSTAVGGLILWQYGDCANAVMDLGFAYGMLSTVITFIQWAPQIYKTFVAKSSGALSLIMLMIQCPGSFIMAYFMAIVSRESISTWLSSLASAIQQLILIIMLLYFDYVKRHAVVSSPKILAINEDVDDNIEAQRLLSPVMNEEQEYDDKSE